MYWDRTPTSLRRHESIGFSKDARRRAVRGKAANGVIVIRTSAAAMARRARVSSTTLPARAEPISNFDRSRVVARWWPGVHERGLAIRPRRHPSANTDWHDGCSPRRHQTTTSPVGRGGDGRYRQGRLPEPAGLDQNTGFERYRFRVNRRRGAAGSPRRGARASAPTAISSRLPLIESCASVGDPGYESANVGVYAFGSGGCRRSAEPVGALLSAHGAPQPGIGSAYGEARLSATFATAQPRPQLLGLHAGRTSAECAAALPRRHRLTRLTVPTPTSRASFENLPRTTAPCSRRRPLSAVSGITEQLPERETDRYPRLRNTVLQVIDAGPQGRAQRRNRFENACAPSSAARAHAGHRQHSHGALAAPARHASPRATARQLRRRSGRGR